MGNWAKSVPTSFGPCGLPNRLENFVQKPFPRQGWLENFFPNRASGRQFVGWGDDAIRIDPDSPARLSESREICAVQPRI